MPRRETNPYQHVLFLTPMVAECWHPSYPVWVPRAVLAVPLLHGGAVKPHSCWRQARWRQLRSCAGTLESTIWAYRTRVAPFGVHCNHAEQDSAERELRESLINWREKLAAGADLNTTRLRRRFPPRVFRHGQRPPPAVSVMRRYWRRSSLCRWWKRFNAHHTVCACEAGQ